MLVGAAKVGWAVGRDEMNKVGWMQNAPERIFQARLLKWVAIFSPEDISNPPLLHWQVDCLTLSHQGSPQMKLMS